jgi:hypothetical protein
MTTKLLYGYREGILTATISALAGHKHLVGSLVRYKLVSKIWCNTRQMYIQGKEYHYLDLNNKNKVRTPKFLID